jgi:3-hydroxyisobutyrate dehydrogenase
MAIGFIGLGNLGTAIAKRLISEGEDLIVWNRTTQKTKDIKAEFAKSPAELMSNVKIVFLCLSDSNAVKTILEGENGLLKSDCSGKIIIDTTTNHFEAVLPFHRMLSERGGSYLETPVLGSVIPASQGNLTLLISGNQKSFKEAHPLLEKIGKRFFFLEKPSLATKMKLVNNFVLGSFMSTIAEAVVLGEDAGVDKPTVLDILSAGAGNSALLNAKKEKLKNDDYSPHFSIAMIHKDLHYLEDMAKSLNRPLFNAIVAKELYDKAIPSKMENLDFSAVYKILKEL